RPATTARVPSAVSPVIPSTNARPFPPNKSRRPYYRVDVGPDCGHALRPAGYGPHIIQQVELALIPLRIEEHRQHVSYCPCCDKSYAGPLPSLVQHGGLLGPR